jgi:hypothetical protein
MTRIATVLAVIGLLFGQLPAAGAQTAWVCGEAVYRYYFPLIAKEGSIMNVSAIESIENLIERQPQETLDGRIVEIFEEAVTVRPVGSDQVRTNISIPGHIDKEELSLGQAVRLGIHQGQPILLAVLDNFADDANYSGLGTRLPTPPMVWVIGIRDGWRVNWSAIPGADSYQVYINDTQDGVSPTEVGIFNRTSIVIPYDGDPPTNKYVGVVAISGLNESDASAWVTDSIAPETPDTFAALNAIAGHNLTIGGNDVSMTHTGFRCWEIEQATDGSGTGATSLGYFYPGDLPTIREYGAGTVYYYRIRALDWAGNASDWTNWDEVWVMEGTIKDLFDGYGGSETSPLENLWWLRIDQMESATGWSTFGQVSVAVNTPNKEGAYGLKTTFNPAYSPQSIIGKSFIVDLTADNRFIDGDYVTLSVYAPAGFVSVSPVVTLYFTTQTSPIEFFSHTLTLETGWNYVKLKKDDFTEFGTPDWSTTLQINFDVGDDDPIAAPDNYLIYDDLRMVKADPGDAATYNDTGLAWDRATNTGTDTGEWHIYEGNRSGEPAKPFGYGQIKTAASPALWYLSHKPLETTNILTGTVQAGIYLKGANGKAGLAFFVADVTAGSWDMYAIEADSDADTITLVKWADGTRTVINSANFTFAPDQILWLGADFRYFDSDGGRINVYASLSEGNLIQAANLVLSEQDTDLSPGGSVGLLSYQANVRFVSFVAGSPSHAEVADVARALDGPILGALVLSDGGELTIAGGQITVGGHSIYTVDTEADGASDDLDTISGGLPNQILILQAANGGRTVVCKDGTGNLSLAGDCSLDNADDTVTMLKRDSNWIELARSNNGA